MGIYLHVYNFNRLYKVLFFFFCQELVRGIHDVGIKRTVESK